jgi:hypothetical protein
MEKIKFPKIPHLPWSDCVTSDDTFLDSIDHFQGMNIVVIEKLDGENFSGYHDGCHARSIDGRDHPSRHFVKNLWNQIAWEAPENLRICAENLFATHSIHYEGLKSYLQVFAVFRDDTCLSWKDTVEWCGLLNLVHVPVLYIGPWDEKIVRGCMTGKSTQGGEQEGYVVRNAEAFPLLSFDRNYGKYVRRNHIRTSDFWLNEAIVPNKLLS